VYDSPMNEMGSLVK